MNTGTASAIALPAPAAALAEPDGVGINVDPPSPLDVVKPTGEVRPIVPRHQVGTKRRVPWPVPGAQRPARGRCGVPGEQLQAAIELRISPAGPTG